MVITTMQTFFLYVGLAAAAAAASGPFAPYITSRPPDVIRILGEEVRGGVKLQRVVFFSRTAQTSGGGIRTGVSWGGYCAVMVAGLGGKAVAAAFSIYGSGHFDLGSAFQRDLARLPAEQAAEWLNRLDARNYAPGIRARFFEAAAANDTYFWPPAVTATLADIQSPKNQLIAPNADHWLNLPGGCERNKEKPWHDNGWMAMQGTYFDYLLKGQGWPFPELRDARMVRSSDGSQLVRFRVKNAVHLTAIEVWHSSTGEPWKSRKWIPITAARHGNWYQASVPAGRDSIVLVSDDRPVTVSSRVLLWRQ